MLNGPTVEHSDRLRLLKHVVASIVLIVLVAGIQIHGLWQSRQEVEERTKLTARNLGSVLATNLAATFQNVDLTLLTAVDLIRLRPSSAVATDRPLVDAFEDLVHRTPGLLGLHATDAAGNVKYGTGTTSFVGVNIADRKYFQALRDNPHAEMTISEPVMGLIIKKWVLVCARRITLPDGQFGGVVYGSIVIEGMAERVTGKPLELGDRDIFVMSDNDLNMIVRYAAKHQDMQFIGQKRSTPHVAALVRSGADSGFFSTTSPFDHIERLFYFEQIAGRPMNLLVGLAIDQAMAAWRRELLYAGITTLIFALLIAFGSRQIYRGQMQTERLVAELAKSNRILSSLSATDSLTGIANRRRFDELIEEEWRRGSRNRQMLALAMLDVDYFKAYNDRYGHQRGDDCLRRIGLVLSQHIRRAGDFVARYGGEEFVIICAATDGEHARRLVEGIRTAVEEMALVHELSPLGRVTVSIGVAAIMPSDSQGTEVLIRQADEALYAAKNKGRNHVELAGAGTVSA